MSKIKVFSTLHTNLSNYIKSLCETDRIEFNLPSIAEFILFLSTTSMTLAELELKYSSQLIGYNLTIDQKNKIKEYLSAMLEIIRE